MASISPSSFLVQKCRRAFTLLEVSFAIAVFSLFAVGSIYAFTQANRFASNSRYRTLALAAAQQKIDQIMATSWSMQVPQNTLAIILRTDGNVATDLANDTTKHNMKVTANTTDTMTTIEETNLPLNNDSFNSTTAGLSSAFTNNDVQVFDKRTTTITKLTDSSLNTKDKSRLMRADVIVSYTYRGKLTSVSISTLRTADDF